MFFEQYSHEPYIATSRFWIKFLEQEEARRDELAKRHEGGVAALGVMEQNPNGAPYFVDARCAIADIALYAYTHVAHAVRGWIERVEGEPGLPRDVRGKSMNGARTVRLTGGFPKEPEHGNWDELTSLPVRRGSWKPCSKRFSASTSPRTNAARWPSRNPRMPREMP